MSLFPRTHFLSQAEQPHHHQAQQSSYHPLFRLFDEFDQYSRAPERAARQSQPNTSSNHQVQSQGHASPFGNLFKSTPTFTPKFDVKETKDGYELHGEFPGIDQKDIEIEFTDSNTLTIKGRTERSYSSGTPPSTSATNNKGAIEAAPEKDDNQTTTTEHRPSSSTSDHKAKVEDEDAALSSEVQNTIAKFRSEKQVTKPQKPAEKPAAEEKYWISERSVGEFERSFSFPTRVDRDAVKASMKNGVLSVLVPKAKMESKRRIVIEDASN